VARTEPPPPKRPSSAPTTAPLIRAKMIMDMVVNADRIYIFVYSQR
jgi:hypothetical protein